MLLYRIYVMGLTLLLSTSISQACVKKSTLLIDNQLKLLSLQVEFYRQLGNPCEFEILQLVVGENVLRSYVEPQQDQFEFPMEIVYQEIPVSYMVLQHETYTEQFFINQIIMKLQDYNHCYADGQIINVKPTYEQCYYFTPNNCNMKFTSMQYLQLFKNDLSKQFVASDTESRWKYPVERDYYFEIEKQLTEEQKQQVFSEKMVDPYYESRLYCISCANLDENSIQACRSSFMQAYHLKDRYLAFTIIGDGIFNITQQFRNANTQLSCISPYFRVSQGLICRNQLLLKLKGFEDFEPAQLYWIQVQLIVQANVNESLPLSDIFDENTEENTCYRYYTEWKQKTLSEDNFLDLEVDLIGQIQQAGCAQGFAYLSVDITQVEIDEYDKTSNILYHCFTLLKAELFDMVVPKLFIKENQYCVFGHASAMSGNLHFRLLKQGVTSALASQRFDVSGKSGMQCFDFQLTRQQVEAVRRAYEGKEGQKLLITADLVTSHQIAFQDVAMQVGKHYYTIIYPFCALFGLAVFHLTGVVQFL